LAQRFFFADGLIAFVVKEKLDEGVVVEALNNGIISSKKGLNFPDVTLDLPALTKRILPILNLELNWVLIILRFHLLKQRGC